MSLPNFFIVGAPKAATTSLYAYLDQHAQVYMSPLKEPNYFAPEMRPEHFSEEARPRLAHEMHALEEYLRGNLDEKRFGGIVSTWQDYLTLFKNVSDEIAIGEASACYLWSPTAARNIAERIPHAKIIVSLRNPADRAFSQYLQMVTAGVIRRSFREQIQENLRNTSRRFGPAWPFLEFGQYAEQLRRYMESFPRSQMHIVFYEDLERAPHRVMSDLFAFLGVDSGVVPDLSTRHHEPRIPRFAGATYFLKKLGVWRYVRSLVPRPLQPRVRSLLVRSRASLAMEPADRHFLVDYYRSDIQNLAGLLGRDLAHGSILDNDS